MIKPQGYGIITDPAKSHPEEHDTFTCKHCNRVVIVPPMFNGQAFPGGFCHGCSGFMCENCTKARELGGPCVTWEQILDQAEARLNALRSYGLAALLLALFLFAGARPARAANPILVCEQATASSVTSRTCTGSVTGGNGGILFMSGSFNAGTIAAGIGCTDTDGDVIGAIGADITSPGGTVNNGSSQSIIAFLVQSFKNTNASEAFTCSWTNAENFCRFYVAQWPGQAIDIWDGNGFFAGTSVSSPMTATSSGNSANASDLTIGLCGTNTNTPSVGTGFTALSVTNTDPVMYYKTGTAGNSSSNCTWTGGTDTVVIETITLRPLGVANSVINHRESLAQSGNTVGSVRVYLTPTPVGSHLVAYVMGQANGGNVTVTFTDTNGDLFTDHFNGSSGGCSAPFGDSCRAAYKVDLPAGNTWIQCNFSPADNTTCAVSTWRAVGGLDVAGAQSNLAGSGSWSGSPISTTNSNDLLLSSATAIAASGSSAITWSGIWTQRTIVAGIQAQSTIASDVVNSTGTYNSTGTQSTASFNTTFGSIAFMQYVAPQADQVIVF